MNSSIKFLNFSPSTKSSLNSPLAESTAIGSPISRHLQTNSKRKTISPLNNPSKMRSAIKIDPHVLTDAQSSGIVSRLVKYYDHSTSEPERNRIVYNKFGDFPLVQLKRNEIKRPIVRSTSVRIAPPSKSVMNPSLRAAIMRSNSFSMSSGIPKITPTKMRAKDDSHQIIRNHEPILDTNYPSSSKSVLDALEKNCRKRINNEELILDRTKKLCAPLLPQQQQSVSEIDSPTRDFIPINNPSISTKRTRDISPIKNASALLNDTQPSKKIKTKNNALLSSLSSSHYNLIPYNSNKSNKTSIILQENSIKRQSAFVSMPTKSKSIESDEKKNDSGNKNELKISQDPPTATVQIVDTQKEIVPTESQKKLHLFNRKPDPNIKFNRARVHSTDSNDDDDDEVKIRFVKPKEVILENYDVIGMTTKDKLSKMLIGLSTGFKSPPLPSKVSENQNKDTVDTAEKDDTKKEDVTKPAATISFVTSTTVSTIAPISSSSTSSVISTNSTLLKLPEAKNNSEQPVSSTTNTSIPASVTAQLPKPSLGGFQFGSSTNADVSKNNLISFTPISTVAPTSNVISTSTSSSSTTSDQNKPLISFTPISKSTTESSISNTAVVTTSALLPVLPTFGISSNTNTLGGFKFGTTSNETQKSNEVTTTGFNFGSNLTSNASTSVISNTNNSTTVSFGTSQLKLSVTSTASSLTSSLFPTNTTQSPVLNFQSTKAITTTAGGFSFGTSTNTLTASTQQGFTFGDNKNNSSVDVNKSSSSFSKPETTVASGIGFSFGGNKSVMSFGSNNNINPMVPTTTAAAQSTFSFGSNPNASSTNTGFTGFNTNVQKTETQPTAGIFSFSQQKPQNTPSILGGASNSSTFNFGASNVTTTQASNTSGFSFGKSANKSSNATGGIFSRLGEKVSATNEVKPFSFSANQQNITSPFGTQNVTTTSVPAFNSSSSNISFGQNSIIGNNANSNNTNNNLFSQSTQNSPSVFGNVQQQQQQQPSTNMFSFNSQGNDLGKTNKFNFGGSNTNISNVSNTFSAAPSTTIFGSTSNNNSSSNVSASFTFNPNTGGITSSTNQNVFGQNSSAQQQQQSPPPAYQFGSSNTNSNQNNVSASFTFSGAASAPTPQASNNAFNFSNSAPVQAPTSFNFQASQQQQQQPNSGGLFNIGTSGSNQNQRRLIRTASRRFK
ncbi:hypothetical protein PVAND_001935 [Polypedilum vanderplanki]|uniref:Uncharacterized protein n=1 Tax=Polypedilum vanderplanki TaxID=319348 RepID=A0A9J6BPG8_POLVA|nr:hypothetical protein PVAND_001935 [Polypedilum vanderplanki]